MATFKSYKELDVWKKSRELLKCVYDRTKKYPKEEDFGLNMQMRRAAISVLSKIAKGQGRQYKIERIQFMYMSRGSFNKLKAQMDVSVDLGYINTADIKTVTEVLESCRKLL